ncbi:VOC family protein [candidate division KSB1 bacterium]|nr:VOC family protein [candidate division KSB1 bacterium]
MIAKQLDHIAFRVTDIDPVVSYYTKKLGYKVVQEMELDFGGTKAVSNVLNLPGTKFYIFVDQGLDWDNIITRWVKKNGSKMHHMAYCVDDIYDAAEEMRKHGVEFTSKDVVDTGGGLKQLFTLPSPVTGMITELIQRERDDIFFVQGNVIELIRSTEGL